MLLVHLHNHEQAFNKAEREALQCYCCRGSDCEGGQSRWCGTNWVLVSMNHDTQFCMDPNVTEAKAVVSSCGHDGPFGATGAKRLKSLGLIENVPGMKPLDMNQAKDAIVRLTREVVSGMIMAGMEVAEIDYAPKMGPTFGAMMVLVRRQLIWR